jgi:hypothetical protein
MWNEEGICETVKQRVLCQARAIKTNGFVVCCRNRRVLRKITAEWKGKIGEDPEEINPCTNHERN